MVTLVGEYVKLTKRGSNHVGLCPFHAEKTGSFNVSAANKFFHCFGCKESGDCFSFVMRMEGVGFPQAARVLAERLGVEIPDQDRAEDAAERRARARREGQLALMDEACRFYERQLAEHAAAHVARAELDKRGVGADTAARFRLGYAPHAWDALATHIARKDRELIPVAEELGLIARRREGNGHYDRFRGRLMFPIRELGGGVIAFSGRVLSGPNGEPPGEADPKYMNSPEGPLYSKGNVLYGLHEARVEVRRNGWALLCEGNFDLLALHQAGFGNALAPMGTAFTAAQAKLLGRFAQRATLLFDGDTAGAKAVRAAYPLLQQQGLRGLVAELPKGDDPDSYLRAHGKDALERLVGNATGIVEYLIDSAAERAGSSAAERAAAIQGLIPVLRAVDNSVEMELFLQRVAQRFGLPDVGAVRRELRRASAATQAAQPSRGSAPSRPMPGAEGQGAPDHSELAETKAYVRLPKLQTELVGVLLDRPALLASGYASELDGLLTSAELRAVLRAAIASIQENGALDLTALFSALQDNPALAWVKERLALQTYRDRDDAEQVLQKGIPLLVTKLAEQERDLGRQILEARRNGDDAGAVRLTKQRDELRRSALLRRER
jgi:DNA primase